MTDEQLAEIKARVQMARPGPWVFREGASVKGSIVGNGWHVDLIGDNYEAWASVDFIAHSRTDIPLLLLEVERLRAEVERLTTPKPGPSTSSGHGFLAWVMQVEDALPVGMAKGVNVEELQRWFEAGVTAEGAAEEVAQRTQRAESGQRVRGEGP